MQATSEAPHTFGLNVANARYDSLGNFAFIRDEMPRTIRRARAFSLNMAWFIVGDLPVGMSLCEFHTIILQYGCFAQWQWQDELLRVDTLDANLVIANKGLSKSSCELSWQQDRVKSIYFF